MVRWSWPFTHRTEVASMASPMATPSASAASTASGTGQPQWTPSCAAVNAATMPIAPWAKLNTPEVL